MEALMALGGIFVGFSAFFFGQKLQQVKLKLPELIIEDKQKFYGFLWTLILVVSVPIIIFGIKWSTDVPQHDPFKEVRAEVKKEKDERLMRQLINIFPDEP